VAVLQVMQSENSINSATRDGTGDLNASLFRDLTAAANGRATRNAPTARRAPRPPAASALNAGQLVSVDHSRYVHRMLDESDTPQRMDEETAFAEEAIALAHEYVQSGATTWSKALSSLFVARATQAMQSCVLLARQGAIGDAMSVGRTVVELDIEHAYIMQKDTSQRWERYVAYEVTSRDKLVQAIAVLHDGKVDQQALAHSRRAALVARNKLGSRKRRKQRGQKRAACDESATVRDRAYATGRKKNYDLAYSDMCGASHGGFSTLWYVTESTDQLPFKVLIGYGKPRAKPIALALQSLMQLLEEAITTTKEPGIGEFRARADSFFKRVVDTYRARHSSLNDG
jgi:hypothetical protein